MQKLTLDIVCEDHNRIHYGLVQSSQPHIVYVHEIERKGLTSHSQVVEVDLHSMVARTWDASKLDIVGSDVNQLESLIVCDDRNDQTKFLRLFPLHKGELLIEQKFQNTNNRVSFLDIELSLFEGSLGGEPFKLLYGYNWCERLYADYFVHLRSSHDGNHVLVVHREQKELHLYSKPAQTFHPLGLKLFEREYAMDYLDRYVFSQDDSKIGIFLDNNHRYIFDIEARMLIPLKDSSGFDLKEFSAKHALTVGLSPAGDCMFIWQKSLLEYYFPSHRYHKWQVELEEAQFIRHVDFDGARATVYWTDPEGNIFLKQLLLSEAESGGRHLLRVEDSNMDLLLHSISDYEHASSDFEKQLIVKSISGAMHCIGKRQPHLLGYLMTLCFYLKDADLFAHFASDVTEVSELMKLHTLLDLCIANYFSSKHLQLVAAHIDRNIGLLRYDRDWIEVVGDFIRRFQLSPNLDECLSNPLSQKLIRALLLAPTGQTVTLELEDPDAPAIEVGAFPESLTLEVRKIEQAARSLQCDPQRNAKEYQVYRTLVDLDTASGSPHSMRFFRMICKFPDEDLKTTLKPLFYFKYKVQYKYLLVYSLLDWSCSILAYLFFGFHFAAEWRLGLLVPIWAILGLKLFYEASCIVGDWKLYFLDSWNAFDLLLALFTGFSTVALHQAQEEGATTRWLVAVRLANMMMLMWRSVTWLRVFKPTRYLVTMILAVFNRMLFFLIILIAFILTYAFMWRVTLSLAEAGAETQMSFYSSLLYSTDIIFGNAANLTEDGQNVSVIQAIVHSLGNVVIALALLNFLIAIISGVYEEVNEDKELFDVKELMVLINELDTFWSGCRAILAAPARLVRGCCAGQKAQLRTGCKYYVLAPPGPDDGFAEVSSKLDALGQALDSRLGGLEELMSAKVDSVSKNLGEVHAKVSGIEAQLQQLLEKLGPK